MCYLLHTLIPLPGAALHRVSYWALMVSFLSASATGLTYLNNLGAITTALGGQKGAHVPFVALFSVANAIGVCGTVSRCYIADAGLPFVAG